MQETVYKCDQCTNILGPKKHISLSFGPYSGIAVPPTIEDMALEGIGGRKLKWGIRENLQSKFLHFCNGKCIGAYFKELLNRVATNA